MVPGLLGIGCAVTYDPDDLQPSKGFSSSVWSTPEALTALERAAGDSYRPGWVEISPKTPKNPASRDAFSFETAQKPPYGHDGPLRTPNTAERVHQMGTDQPGVPAGGAVRWRHVRRVAWWYGNALRVVLSCIGDVLCAIPEAWDWY